MGQVHFENFDFLVKVKSPLGQSIFFFFFFFFFSKFFFCSRFRPGQVSRSVRVNPGRSGQMGQTVVGGDVMDDVAALDACGTCARVAHVHVWHVRALAPTVWRVCAREI